MEAMADPKSLLRRAQTFLADRDFSSSQILANQAMQRASDPSLAAEADRILSVAGILLAGKRRDFYSVLRLTRSESDDSRLVWFRYVELAETLAKPELNDVAFAQEAYDLAFHAFSVLSDPEKKRNYDAETVNEESSSSSSSPSSSFWTVCPYCFWLFQFEKVYEECCLRCQNCSRAFHGVSIGAPPAEIVVSGKDQYFLRHGIFPLCYKVKENFADIKEEEEEEEEKEKADNNGGSVSCTDKSEGFGGGGNWGKRVAKEPARRMKNVKSAAVKKKKKNITVSEFEGNESENGKEEEINSGCDLVYLDGVDDLFLGLEDLDIP